MNGQPAWFGSPPAHWDTVRLKYIFREKSGPPKGDLPPGAISFGEVVQKDMLNEDTLGSYQEVHSGDFLVNPINLNYDLKSLRTALSTIDVRVSPAYIVLEADRRLYPRYLRWLLYQFDVAHMKTLGAGVRQTIGFADIGGCEVRLPPPDEQERIGNFLDEQTTRIDALIANKALLRDRVHEYQEAELSRLVRTGFSADRVRTGLEVLPEAPEGWRVTAFKRALLGMEQGWSPQCESRPAEAGEWGVLKVGCVNGPDFDANENKALPPQFEPDLACVLRPGDVLMSRANTRELVGMAAIVDAEYPNLLLCDKLYRLKLRTDWLNPAYAVLLLRCDYVRRQIELGASGASSSMQNISQDVVRQLIVAIPSLDEQARIVEAAAKVRSACTSLAKHVAEHIERLREYRFSLISSAVTGQLDAGAFNEQPRLAA